MLIDSRQSVTFSSRALWCLETCLQQYTIYSITFSSRALWCSNSDLRAFRTSTSLDTPAGDDACRLTTVIRRDLSCLDTKHSRCSSNNCNQRAKQPVIAGVHTNIPYMQHFSCVAIFVKFGKMCNFFYLPWSFFAIFKLSNNKQYRI